MTANRAPLADTGNPPLATSAATDPAARDGRRVTPSLPAGSANDIEASVRRFFGGE